jgi:hypothetical protein
METIFNILAPAILLLSSVTGWGGDLAQAPQIVESVEMGLSEMSPRGEAGGFAMPASGCSVAASHGLPIHDCSILPDITADKLWVRLGDPVTVTWNPRVHVNCVLSNNLMALIPAPNGNVPGSRIDYPTGETTYTIICDGEGNRDAVTVKVLPRIQET